MKTVIEFDLNDPDDRVDCLRCVKSSDMYIVLFEILHNLHRKYEDSECNLAVLDDIKNLITEYNLEEVLQ